MKPSDRIHDIAVRARKMQEAGGYVGKFQYPDDLLSAILTYLDEQATTNGKG